jgi:hypothetical protein
MAIFAYFSFVTLATLGYGDVTPVGAAARTFSSFEAVVGQMFIAITIARLVAMRATEPAPPPPVRQTMTTDELGGAPAARQQAARPSGGTPFAPGSCIMAA